MKDILVILLVVASVTGFTACQDYYEDGGLVSTEPLEINSLEFLKSRPDLFDTTLIVIEKSGLEKVISSEDVTFFAPHKKSITSAMKKVNEFVQKKRDSLGYNKDTVLLEDVPAETWRKLLSRYIFKGQYLRDDITKGKTFSGDNGKRYITGGEDVDSYLGYKMKLYCDWTTWDNVAEAGPRYIYIVDAKGTDVSDPETANFQFVQVITSNIKTTSGTVHVLGRGHEFGFDNSGSFIPVQK